MAIIHVGFGPTRKREKQYSLFPLEITKQPSREKARSQSWITIRCSVPRRWKNSSNGSILWNEPLSTINLAPNGLELGKVAAPTPSVTVPYATKNRQEAPWIASALPHPL